MTKTAFGYKAKGKLLELLNKQIDMKLNNKVHLDMDNKYFYLLDPQQYTEEQRDYVKELNNNINELEIIFK